MAISHACKSANTKKRPTQMAERVMSCLLKKWKWSAVRNQVVWMCGGGNGRMRSRTNCFERERERKRVQKDVPFQGRQGCRARRSAHASSRRNGGQGAEKQKGAKGGDRLPHSPATIRTAAISITDRPVGRPYSVGDAASPATESVGQVVA